MKVDYETWQSAMGLLTAALIAIGLGYAVWQIAARRRRAIRRIAAARVRAGHVPGDLPSVRGELTGFGEIGPDRGPQTLPGYEEYADDVVDEQPRLRLCYVDPMAKKVEATLQVQHLDVQNRLLIGYCKLPGDTRQIPLRSILAARIAGSGQRFNVDRWADAVHVARRRRGLLA